MKIAMSQLFSKTSKWFLGLIALTYVSTTSVSWSANGEELFNTHCATCHKVLDNSTGPKLQGVRAKWEEGGALEGSLYLWVKDWSSAAAKDPYAASVAALIITTEAMITEDPSAKEDASASGGGMPGGMGMGGMPGMGF
jgi:mono/diheme cytochrome c family protein